MADSIQFTQLIDPPIALQSFQSTPFNYSPDRQLIAVVTRKGNLRSGENEYVLSVLRAREIADVMQSTPLSRQPRLHPLVSMATSMPEHAIEQVTWSGSGQQLAFIGRDGRNPAQVYVYDLQSSQLNCLTNVQKGVATFGVAWKRGLLMYAAYEEQDWTERNARGYTVRSHNAFEVETRVASEVVHNIRHWILDLETKVAVPIAIPISWERGRYFVSPDEEHLALLTSVHHVPEHWYAYELVASTYDRRPGDAKGVRDRSEYDDAFNRPAPWILQFYLVHLSTAVAKPLIDAPSTIQGLVTKAVWLSPQKVLLTNTFMPLDEPPGVQTNSQKTDAAIVEVDLGSGAVVKAMDLPERTPDNSLLWLRDIGLLSGNRIRVTQRQYLTEVDTTTCLKRAPTYWRKERCPQLESSPNSSFELRIAQDMNTPPDIVAMDRAGRSTKVTTLNPQLDNLTLGRVEQMEWKDRLGRTFTGGLVWPPSADRQRRYPVVLQTYGFNKHEFLLDGPNATATAYAARALANRDILVLQMPELDRQLQTDQAEFDSSDTDELSRFMAGLDGAIDALAQRNFADPSKLGVIGFSREGMHVHYAITFSKRKFAAALISDSITATPLSYVLAYGYSRPGMLEWEEGGLIGAPLWGAGVARWVERSPLFHLDRIQTPLRLESIGVGMPPLWETFAILKRHRRPVEFVHIPSDSHRLQTPWGRLTSQQGAVDWFSFWLKNEEVGGSEKAEQYRYWRFLRTLHKEAIAAASENVSSR